MRVAMAMLDSWGFKGANLRAWQPGPFDVQWLHQAKGVNNHRLTILHANSPFLLPLRRTARCRLLSRSGDSDILLDRAALDSNEGAVRILELQPISLSGFCCAIDPVNHVFMITCPCLSEPPKRTTPGRHRQASRRLLRQCASSAQILSNGGFISQARPEIVEQIRRHGFDGPLPGPSAGPWSAGFREWYFGYDAREDAERALGKLRAR